MLTADDLDLMRWEDDGGPPVATTEADHNPDRERFVAPICTRCRGSGVEPRSHLERGHRVRQFRCTAPHCGWQGERYCNARACRRCGGLLVLAT